MGEKLELGAAVREKVSGFEGVVVARTEYLSGACARCAVLAKTLDKDGKPMDWQWFDEPMLKRINF